MRKLSLAAIAAAALAGPLWPAQARAAGAPATASSGMTGGGASAPAAHAASGGCSVGSTIVNTFNPFSHCNPARQVLGAVGSIPGKIAGAAATGIMDQVTNWMVKAAQTISGWVVKEAGVITHPDLNADWYLHLFSGLAALGGALAGLVALIALASAAIRKDPDALGEVIYGVARAGIGTSVVVALTIIALAAADGIANQFAQQMPADFYKALGDQWGGSGFGGFGAAALAFLVAFVATIAGLLVWLELIVREAAIYIAVLFFPVGLAASIWPALRSWVRRLSMLLLMFVMLRPVVVIVLALAGSVTASGLSFGNGSIPHSVGTILAGVVIFALAAFTPWALMFLLGTEVGVMHSRAGAQGSGGGSRSSSSEQAGGGLAVAGLAARGGGGLAMAGAGAEGGGAPNSGGGGLSSLGGSGSSGAGAGASGGSIAAAAGWVGAAAGAASKIGGQLGQHAAARIHVAAGRSGVAPGGVLPASAGGLDGGSGSSQEGSADREPPSPVDLPGMASRAANEGPEQLGGGAAADSPSTADTASPPSPPTAAESFGTPPPPKPAPPAEGSQSAQPTSDPAPPASRPARSDRGDESPRKPK